MNATRTLDHLYLEIQESHSRSHSWQITGDEYGINKAMARLLANGYKPGNKIRNKLGLPALAPAPVCPTHGVVHVGRCPSKRKPRVPWMTPEEVEERLEYIKRNYG